MKPLAPLILVFVLAGTSSAGTISIIAQDVGNSELLIGYEVTGGSELPVGFGLDIELSGPATFRDVLFSSPHFPIHPANVVVDSVTGDITNYGSPVAPAGYPNTLDGLGTSGITIEMAVEGEPIVGELLILSCPIGDINGDCRVDNQDLEIFAAYWLATFGAIGDLNGDGTVNFCDYGIFVDGRYDAPPTEASLLWIQLDGNGAATTTVTISENSLRCGIVDDQGMPFDVILPEPFTMVVPEPATILLLGLGGLALLRRRRR